MDKQKIARLLNEVYNLAAKVKPQPHFVSFSDGDEEATEQSLKDAVKEKNLAIWEQVKKGS